MKQGEILPELAGEQKVFPDELPRLYSHLIAQRLVMEQEPDAVRRTFGRADQEAGVVVHQLQPDAAGVAADDRLAFPEAFGDRKPETFTGGFLDNDVCQPLQRIDGPVGIGRQEQDVNIGIPRRGFQNFIEHLLPLSIAAL